MSEKVGEARTHLSILANRPKSTYGNRALSINHRAELDTKDWVPKQVLADCLKRKLSWEHESDNVTADQFAMQYVKLGDRVIFELTVDDTKQNVPATVKYIGPVYHSNFKPGIYAGLKLDIPAGDTNGRVGDRAYFRCLKHHGKFVKISHILAVQNPRTQQYTRILPTVYK
ncbi:CAP-Gly domain-containing linker protein 4-like [Xenia sp. Carnegie-2017]|uniref:CAP-Gly domain-containing linker protein 4-like n=1 Tax=Xenia sp. Carnegie-2017 TaxID=2897299 RepID=UPI001F03811C|nr:CAP-Gly domain-containing linker protein 4-like [Xenia sp. Carnegie-2017]